jgi:hypothetical protein
MATASVLGPNGEGWTIQMIQHPPVHPPIDTCDMVLTKDVTQIKQLFNNYGPLSNLELLSEYGFIDENSQNDYVSLRRELFDLPNFHQGKREYWKRSGFKLVMGIARASHSSHLDEMEILLHGGKCPMTGGSFVRWSLAIGKHGWVRFPLKIWIMIRLLSPTQWRDFDNASEQMQVGYFVSRFVAGVTRLDILEMPPASVTYLEVERWNDLLADALDKRLTRYNDNLTSEECFKLRKEALSSVWVLRMY